MNIQHLKTLCCDSEIHPWANEPMVLNGWTVATNAKAMLMIRGEVPGARPASERAKKALPCIMETKGHVIGVERLAIIMAWIGPYKLPKTICCPNCGYIGPGSQEKRPGYLFGVPIYGALLAKYLDGLESAEPVTLRSSGKTVPLYLDGAGWRVVISPILDGKGREGDQVTAIFGPQFDPNKEVSDAGTQ